MTPLLKTRALGTLLVGAQAVRRLLYSLESAVEGAALHGLSHEQLNALTAFCYARARLEDSARLFEWEERWFATDLPRAPAKLLIGGAGRGRELHALRDLGYTCVAFDPVAPVGDAILRGCYEDLLRGTRGHALRQAIERAAPFDAVVLGWGSLTHVPGAETRAALVRTLRELCDGPILASFWMKQPAARGRARSLGVALARQLPGGGRHAVEPGDSVHAHCGYAHGFDEAELEALAEQAGLLLHLYREGYPHATLRPRG